MDRIAAIAKVCHEALDEYRETLGEHPVGHWERTDPKHRQAIKDGVRLVLHGTSAKSLHELGVTRPTAAARTHAVPYAELDEPQRKKAALFLAVARALGCGTERWAVKTGTDPDAARVSLTPQQTTIEALASVAAPPEYAAGGDPPARVPGGPEFQVYTLTGVTVSAVKEEADSDFHLALADAQGDTMIAEVPCPGCCAGSPWLDQITAARQAVSLEIPNIAEEYQDVNRAATITGVGFFDRLHGQRGVAPNGVELHPVLAIQFDPPAGAGGQEGGAP